jgi:hypothetical protein
MIQAMELKSTITCPDCGAASTETMPIDACQWLYECPVCGSLLRPLPGDCCVFCSYGTVKCPPQQTGGACCGPVS